MRIEDLESDWQDRDLHHRYCDDDTLGEEEDRRDVVEQGVFQEILPCSSCLRFLLYGLRVGGLSKVLGGEESEET